MDPPRRWWIAIGVVATLLLFLHDTAAADTLRGRSVHLPAGATVTGDLTASGGTVKIYGNVTEDLIARAGFLNQVGQVGGDVTVRAGRAELRGPIGGSLHAAGGSLSLYGTVAGDVRLTGGQLTLVEGAVVGGDLVVRGGTLIIVAGARVEGDLRGQVLTATIEGTIGHDVDLTVGRLDVVPGATIGGMLRYESRSAAGIEPGAAVTGPVTRRDPADRFPAGELLFWHTAAIPRFLAMLVLGIGLVLLVPGRMTAIADAPRRALLPTLLTGLGITLFAPIALLVLALLVITLPLAAIGGVGYLAVAIASAPIVGLALGRTLLRRPAGERRRIMSLLALLLGLVLLTVVRQLPLPLADGIGAVGIAILGFGAVANRHTPGNHAAGTPEPRPVASFLLGVVTGGVIMLFALAAIATAVAGTAAALATASQSASFVWTIAPFRLGLTAWQLALAAILLPVGAWGLLRWRGA